MIQVLDQTEGNIIMTKANGKLNAEDYEKIYPIIEDKANEHEKLRLYFEMEDFHGWDAEAFWKDVQVDAKHFNSFDKVAMVGDQDWEDRMTQFMKPFTPAEVRYFDSKDKEEAMEWIRQ